MGLNTRNHEKRTYVGIISGKFATKADANTEGAVKRYSEKKQMDVYEILYDDLTGRITDIRIEDSQYGKQLIFGVSDVGDYIQVQIPVDSKYFWHFAMKIPNVNLNQDVMLIPYSFEDKTKKDSKGNPQKIIGMNFYQPATKSQNNKVDYYYKDDNAHGKPLPEKDMDEDDYKIYKIKEQKFLIEQVKKIVILTPEEVYTEMKPNANDSQRLYLLKTSYIGKPKTDEQAPDDDNLDLPF